MNETKSFLQQATDWIRNSVMLKFAVITILMLLLLIPLFMISDIIEERESLNQQAINEVSGKWAGPQLINGPMLVIPLDYVVINDDEMKTETRYHYILPEHLDIKGTVFPETLNRGIYEVVVYKSDLSISGSFHIETEVDSAQLSRVRFNDAFIAIGVSDLRGIEENLDFRWDKHKLEVTPGTRIPETIPTGVTIDIDNLKGFSDQTIPFSLSLKLQGSQQLSFVPLGSTTTANINSAWTAPSFTGNSLPDLREHGEEGFTANWKVLELNRNYPQSWTGNRAYNQLESSSFGVNLLIPLDDYQKSMRSAKYGVMTIALTFLVFFLVEVLNKQKIHPFQYALVGLALCLFYILLVSLSEHIVFNLAYAISTLAIVSMITLYSLSIFRAGRLSMVLAVTLLGIYGFLFVTLQMADYALLLGSVGLTIILALTMYFTRNVNWYKLQISQG